MAAAEVLRDTEDAASPFDLVSHEMGPEHSLARALVLPSSVVLAWAWALAGPWVSE